MPAGAARCVQAMEVAKVRALGLLVAMLEEGRGQAGAALCRDGMLAGMASIAWVCGIGHSLVILEGA
jgi:hypothetical protein